MVSSSDIKIKLPKVQYGFCGLCSLKDCTVILMTLLTVLEISLITLTLIQGRGKLAFRVFICFLVTILAVVGYIKRLQWMFYPIIVFGYMVSLALLISVAIVLFSPNTFSEIVNNILALNESEKSWWNHFKSVFPKSWFINKSEEPTFMFIFSVETLIISGFVCSFYIALIMYSYCDSLSTFGRKSCTVNRLKKRTTTTRV